MHLFKFLCLVVLTLLVSPACSKEDKQQAQAREFSPAKQSGLTFNAPDDWTQEQPQSRMRRAQYRLPKVDGDREDAQVVVFYFGGSGGSVQANVDRWVGMFTKEDGTPAADASKVSKKQVNGLPVTIVDVSGTYNSQSMGPMGSAQGSDSASKPHFRMLAAVAETSTGPWFIRLTGPKNTVDKWEKSFFTFVDTFKES